MISPRAPLHLVLVIILGCVLPTHADDLLQPGRTELAFSVGLGNNFHTSLRHGNVREDVKFLALIPSWGKVLKAWDGCKSLGLAIEGFLSYARQESENRYAIGVTPLAVYNFKQMGKMNLFADAGLGLAYTDLDPEKFGSEIVFTPQAGIGFRYALGNDRYFRLAYRFVHMSNGGWDEDNKSIDSNFLLLGISLLR